MNSLCYRGPAALFIIIIVCASCFQTSAQQQFRVIAFYTAKNDRAHISFVREANRWFAGMSLRHQFQYDSTSDWSRLNDANLSRHQVVVFLDTRPENPQQRKAFENYMKKGGSWMGFHFAGFALTPSAFPQNWNWYHNEFLGVGEYKSNTWRPVPAVLRVEHNDHDATRNLPTVFTSAACEWYRWKNDITKNPDIQILLSIDPTSFPLGTGPKEHEIWHAGYYPVVWTNVKYNMIYLNMGHNDIDYTEKTYQELSSSFSSIQQNQLILDALMWLGKASKIK
jgi:uncharacterized protein